MVSLLLFDRRYDHPRDDFETTIDFISIFPSLSLLLSFLQFFSFSFLFPSQYQSRSATLPTREGGWLTALVQKSRERRAHFRHSDLLHHRRYLIENCPPASIWTSNSHSTFGKLSTSFFVFFPLFPLVRNPRTNISTIYCWIKCKSRSNEYHNARARFLEGNGSWKRALWSLRTEETLSARVYLSVAF